MGSARYGLDVVRRAALQPHRPRAAARRIVCAALASQIAAHRGAAGSRRCSRSATSTRCATSATSATSPAGYVALLERGRAGEVYNLCSGEGVHVAEVIALLREPRARPAAGVGSTRRGAGPHDVPSASWAAMRGPRPTRAGRRAIPRASTPLAAPCCDDVSPRTCRAQCPTDILRADSWSSSTARSSSCSSTRGASARRICARSGSSRQERGERLERLLLDLGFISEEDLQPLLVDATSACRGDRAQGVPDRAGAARQAQPQVPAARQGPAARADRTARSSSRWPIPADHVRPAGPRGRDRAARSSRGSARERDILEALEAAYGNGAARRHERQRRRRRRARVPRRRRGGRRPPARPRQRGAGHPARQRADQPRRRAARVGHPHRAVRERAQGPLPHRRRAARRRDAAAPPAGGHRVAHQDHGEAQHRRAPPAAGRPHQAPHDGQGDRPPRLDAADAVRRERRAAYPRPLEHRRRPRDARLPRGHARSEFEQLIVSGRTA